MVLIRRQLHNKSAPKGETYECESLWKYLAYTPNMMKITADAMKGINL
jgi:hypothetical protein